MTMRDVLQKKKDRIKEDIFATDDDSTVYKLAGKLSKTNKKMKERFY